MVTYGKAGRGLNRQRVTGGYGNRQDPRFYGMPLPGQYGVPPGMPPGMPPQAPLQPPPGQPRVHPGLIRWLCLSLIPFVVLLVVFLLLVLIGKPYVVNGQSMTPTLLDGDRVFVVPYRGNTTPDRGDVVVVNGVGGTNDMLIKRVVAISGDKIMYGDGLIVVNDTFTYKNTNRSGSETYETLVPDGHIFVMGDNESHSLDSRSFGPVPKSNITGKAMFIFWPPGDIKKL